MRLYIVLEVVGHYHSIEIVLVTEHAKEKYAVSLKHNTKNMRRLSARSHLPDIRILR